VVLNHPLFFTGSFNTRIFQIIAAFSVSDERKNKPYGLPKKQSAHTVYYRRYEKGGLFKRRLFILQIRYCES